MNSLVIVCGDLACGKSTWAKQIARRNGLVFFDKDTIKEILADSIGFKNREENKRLSKATFELMINSISRLQNNVKGLVLEANFTSEEVNRLINKAQEYDIKPILLNLTADVDILYERFMYRAKNENRHPVHCTDDLLNKDSFKTYILEHRVKNIKNCTIFDIDGNDFSYQENVTYNRLIDDCINVK